MLPLKEFKQGYTGFPSLINYFGFIDEGVMLNKDGSLMACISYAGEDMDSSQEYEHAALTSRMNHLLARLGTHWMINVDAIRIPALAYPKTHSFVSATTLLIEDERRNYYQHEGSHFETLYVMTFSYKPSKIEHNHKLQKIFLKETKQHRPSHDQLQETLLYFNKMVEELTQDLSSCLSLQRMDSQAIYRFLHLCITGKYLDLALPNPPVHLNYILGGYDFNGGIRPQIDQRSIGMVSVIDFPSQSYRGIFNELNTLPFECRFSNRFIAMDPRGAEKQLIKLRTKLQVRQLSMMSIVSQVLSVHSGDRFVNEEAMLRVADANEALNEARAGDVRYGYYTATISVIGSEEEVKDRTKKIRHILENKGFPARIETMNAIEAYLGSLPGHAYPNIRKPIIHTFNLAHMIPLTTIWAGLSHNPSPMFPAHSAPVFYAATSGNTPFRFHLHVSDVGHTLVLGPTGAGKSTLLGLITAQFMRYPGAQIFSFDKGLSQYALCKASNGNHYHILGPHSPLTFAPFSHLKEESDQLWAASWVEELLLLQGVDITPKHRNSIHDAIASLEGGAATFTDFYTNIQDNLLKEALMPFVEVENGMMAHLFDAPSDSIAHSHYQVFELDEVMKKDSRYNVPILTYLFRSIEKRLDGSPTLIILDEAWNMLSHPLFREKIRHWLKTLRKANAAVIFATQSISDIVNSPIKDVIIESCPTKIFLPNPEAMTENSKPFYLSLGLNHRQVEIIADSLPKRHYYYHSPNGCRLIELALGKIALAFTGISSPEDIRSVRAYEETYGEQWPAYWLKDRVSEGACNLWLSIYKRSTAP